MKGKTYYYENVFELLQSLKRINRGIPFDSSVVTGDDWQYKNLISVTSDENHIYLHFSDTDPEKEIHIEELIEILEKKNGNLIPMLGTSEKLTKVFHDMPVTHLE